MIYVSNHGGRQLDHGRGAMEMLPEIVAAVGGRAPLIVDGGFCRGTDIVKALAAGADLVGLGRMQCIGLAAGGQAGLVRLLEILEQEIHTCLGLLGVAGWSALDQSYLHPAARRRYRRHPRRIPAADARGKEFLLRQSFQSGKGGTKHAMD